MTLRTTAIAVLLMGLAAIPLVTKAFSEPNPNSYPTHYQPGEVPEFLNASSAGQIKTGSLLIGDRSGTIDNCNNAVTTGCSRLCLNADPANGTTDGNCITTWSDLTGATNGTFLHLLADGYKLPNGTTYVDRGYVRTAANTDSSQLISLIAEPSGSSGTTALRANGISDSSFAAQFAGTLVINNDSANAKLCLNDLANDGQPAGTCITQWSDVLGNQLGTVIRLQTMTSLSTHVPDQGSAATVGPFQAGSLVLGLPATTVPNAYTCGDGICSIGIETKALCPHDCP